MAEEPHSAEDCIFAKSKWQIFTDAKTGDILYCSPAATLLLASSFTKPEEALHNFVGKKLLSFLAPGYSKDIEEGVIIPAELCNPQNNDYSKWIYACSHFSINPTTQQTLVVWSLEDIENLKNAYKQNLQTPMKIEDIKKISIAVPEYIIDAKTVLGSSLCLLVSERGEVSRMYPLESFMGIVRHNIVGRNVISLIKEDDHLLFTQIMAECQKHGACNGIVRWSSANQDRWTQLKSVLKPNESKKDVLIIFHELLDAKNLDQSNNQYWGNFGRYLPSPISPKIAEHIKSAGTYIASPLTAASHMISNGGGTVLSFISTKSGLSSTASFSHIQEFDKQPDESLNIEVRNSKIGKKAVPKM
jgi:hypothetical protein